MIWSTLIYLDKYFLRMHQMQAIRMPTKRNQNSVFNFITDTQSQISSESEWIRQREDLAALGHGAEHGWFNAVVESMLNKVSRRLTLVSSAPKRIQEPTQKAVRSDELVLPSLPTRTLQRLKPPMSFFGRQHQCLSSKRTISIL